MRILCFKDEVLRQLSYNVLVNKNILMFCASFLVVGAVLGTFLGYYLAKSDYDKLLSAIKPLREGKTDHKFINPLLACDLPEAKDVDEYSGLEKNINSIIEQQKSEHAVNDVSLYLIRNGLWVGINENTKYEPASMLKVVLMIAYLKQKETHPDLFSQTLLYTPEIKHISDQIPFQASSTLTVNGRYPIDKLINKMIIESDNTAMYLLLSGIDTNSLNDVYTDLGISTPDNNGIYKISAKTYSLFFRILYNATYLNREDSEFALALLSQAHFEGGIVAGLPKGTVVSHKYGERVITAPDGSISGVELHDCGFIYLPSGDKPYFLCVMTKGDTLEGVKGTITAVSSYVYAQLSK